MRNDRGSGHDPPKGDVIVASPAGDKDSSPEAECWSFGDVGRPTLFGTGSSRRSRRARSLEESNQNGSMPFPPTFTSFDDAVRPYRENSDPISSMTYDDSFDDRVGPFPPTVSSLSSTSIISRQRRRMRDHVALQHAQFMQNGSYNRYNDVDELIRSGTPPLSVTAERIAEPTATAVPVVGDETLEEDIYGGERKSITKDRRFMALVLLVFAMATGLAIYFIVSRLSGNRQSNVVGQVDDPSVSDEEDGMTGKDSTILFVFMDPFRMELVMDSPNDFVEDILATVALSWLGGFMTSISQFDSLELDQTIAHQEGRYLTETHRTVQAEATVISAHFDGIVKVRSDSPTGVDLTTIQALLKAVLDRAFSVPNIDFFLNELRESGMPVGAVIVFDAWENEIGSSGLSGRPSSPGLQPSQNELTEPPIAGPGTGAPIAPTKQPITTSPGVPSTLPPVEVTTKQPGENPPSTEFPLVDPTMSSTEKPTKWTATQTPLPAAAPTREPGSSPIFLHTPAPTQKPPPPPIPQSTMEPTRKPRRKKTPRPTPDPTPESRPTPRPTQRPHPAPTPQPSPEPTRKPQLRLTPEPTRSPRSQPTHEPTRSTPFPTFKPTPLPTRRPTSLSTQKPSPLPTFRPTKISTPKPSPLPIFSPTASPTKKPSAPAPPGGVPAEPATESPTGQLSDDRVESLLISLSGDKVFAANTAQSRAYEWLVYEDDYPTKEANDEQIVERFVIALLFFSLGGESWWEDTKFLSSNGVCKWFGVECNKDGLVTHLDWNSNRLSGAIPEEISSLRELEALLLHSKGDYPDRMNKITGSLPSSMQDLQHLEDLRLYRCGINGMIPTWIGELSALKRLMLMENQIVGPIPRSLTRLNRLEYINFSRNPIEGTLPKSIGQLHKLEDLRIGNTRISGPLPTEIGRLKYLAFLNLQKNDLTGTIPTELGKLSRLETMWLDDNDLSGAVPSELGNSESLESLFLDRNRLAGTVPSSLGRLSAMERLRLHKNELSGSMPDELCDLLDRRGGPLYELSADCTVFELQVICPCCTCCGEGCYEE